MASPCIPRLLQHVLPGLEKEKKRSSCFGPFELRRIEGGRGKEKRRSATHPAGCVPVNASEEKGRKGCAGVFPVFANCHRGKGKKKKKEGREVLLANRLAQQGVNKDADVLVEASGALRTIEVEGKGKKGGGSGTLTVLPRSNCPIKAGRMKVHPRFYHSGRRAGRRRKPGSVLQAREIERKKGWSPSSAPNFSQAFRRAEGKKKDKGGKRRELAESSSSISKKKKTAVPISLSREE